MDSPGRKKTNMRRVLPLLLLACLLLPACGGDDGSPSTVTRVTIEIVDTDDEPLPGLEVALWNDSPYLQDVGKAMGRVIWTQPITARTRLTVTDIEGDLVRLLTDGEHHAGSHMIVWDGRDSEGVHQYSGRYSVKLEGFDRETGTEVEHTESFDVWMVIGSFREEQCVGTTDDRGRIVLRDRRLFPQLYDRPAIHAYDETGEYTEDIELDEDMVFLVRDPDSGITMRTTGRVRNARDTVRLVWGAALPAPGEQTPPAAKRGVPPLTLYGLRVTPNPFN
jgi:hypothetical protein